MLAELARHGITAKTIHANLSPAILVEMALSRGEGKLAANGALVAYTGERTARSPKDKFTVREPSTEGKIDWAANQPMSPELFDNLVLQARGYASLQELFVIDAVACAEPGHSINVRVIAEQAWQALFAQDLFRRVPPAGLESFEPDWIVYSLPNLRFDPVPAGLNSPVVIAASFDRKTVLIAGTHYAGEIKKSIFTILNGLLPWKGVLSMHCSANIGAEGDTALFFGLSGTGKTTLSADPERRLIGDDEHGWSDAGVFNVEGGCYAKTIDLSEKKEPQIFRAVRFGSVLENVPLDPTTREPDYTSQRITENTRAAYPLDFIPNAEPSGCGPHPTNVFFLTCDAFGVLPPISRLNSTQAMEHFLCGYTAKVAGTEVGVTKPQATFSTCFASPFLPLPPKVYAELLRQKLDAHTAPVWLINTGWSGGGPGVGKRISLEHTRAMLRAALTGELARMPFETEPFFGLSIPTECPGIPSEILNPKRVWGDPAAYDSSAKHLAARIEETWKKYQ
ncbi:phosphoenolpyruvate carboxykinase (ATP) [Zavarzinella formosa]|uniref:phosphoenolpyruvate carboxykinase (ATP) n=1 Tax=Zavarzinella formosa TaxID=360055 RepID=UPI0002E67F8C|nr:phosphoenolpyruvate carboxykinase (ATP) [Zavarzinella formosa]